MRALNAMCYCSSNKHQTIINLRFARLATLLMLVRAVSARISRELCA